MSSRLQGMVGWLIGWLVHINYSISSIQNTYKNNRKGGDVFVGFAINAIKMEILLVKE